jgi:DNA-binding Lrp family transcriptional regulator
MFDGKTYDPARDRDRLRKQLGAVKFPMLDGKWRTLEDIAAAVGAPPASVSARLRDLRKQKFGGYTVERGYLGQGLFQYRVAMSSIDEDKKDA